MQLLVYINSVRKSIKSEKHDRNPIYISNIVQKFVKVRDDDSKRS